MSRTQPISIKRQILRLMEDGRERTINDVATRLKLPRAVAKSALLSLNDAGYMQTSPLPGGQETGWRIRKVQA